MRRLISLFVFVTLAVQIASAAPENKVKNPNFFIQAPGDPTQAAHWEAGPFAGGYVRSKLNGAWTALVQNPAANAQYSGVCQTIPLHQKSPQVLRVTVKVAGENIENATTDLHGANLYVEETFMDGTATYYGPPWEMDKGVGTFPLQTVGFNTGTLPAPYSGKPVDTLLVCPMLSNVSGKAWFRSVSVQEFPPLSTALFSVLLDDGNLSQYENRDIFTSRSIPATIAAVTDFMKKAGNPNQFPFYAANYMNVTMAKTLKTLGFGFASHSDTHADLKLLTDAQIVQELRRSKYLLGAWGLATNDFVIPYGSYNWKTLGLIQKVYRSARNVWSQLSYHGAYSYGIGAFEIQRDTTLSTFKSWVDNAIAEKAALIVFTHQIEVGACPLDEEGIYCTTRTFLEQALDYVKSKSSLITPKKYDQVVTTVIQ